MFARRLGFVHAADMTSLVSENMLIFFEYGMKIG